MAILMDKNAAKISDCTISPLAKKNKTYKRKNNCGYINQMAQCLGITQSLRLA